MAKKGKAKFWDTLSPEVKICYVVYEGGRRKQDIWLGKIVRSLNGEVSKATVGKCVNKLLDLGILDSEWREIDSKWTRVLTIEGEARSFVQGYSRRIKAGGR